MARKKKDIISNKILNVKETLSSDEVKNVEKITDSNYVQGNVVLKLRHGNKDKVILVTHNSPTRLLFYGLALVMRIDPTETSIQDRLPRYLSVGSGSSTPENDSYKATSLDNEILSYGSRKPLSVYGGIIDKENERYVKTTWQGIIPYNSVQNTPIRELGLFATNPIDSVLANTMVARVVLPNSIVLETGYSLVVEWSIKFVAPIANS